MDESGYSLSERDKELLAEVEARSGFSWQVAVQHTLGLSFPQKKTRSLKVNEQQKSLAIELIQQQIKDGKLSLKAAHVFYELLRPRLSEINYWIDVYMGKDEQKELRQALRGDR